MKTIILNNFSVEIDTTKSPIHITQTYLRDVEGNRVGPLTGVQSITVYADHRLAICELVVNPDIYNGPYADQKAEIHVPERDSL